MAEQKNEKKEEKKGKVSIFIDGSNLYHSLKNIGVEEIDFDKLIKKLKGNRELVSVYYYNAPLDINYNSKTYWNQQRFFAKLRKLPFFKVILCKMRRIVKGGKILGYEVKGDDVHLAVDLLSGAFENLYDVAIIVSGDEDFVPALKKVQNLGKKVENAYFISSSSSALKNSSNTSICINQFIKELI